MTTHRRTFLQHAGAVTLAALGARPQAVLGQAVEGEARAGVPAKPGPINLFLCGDVMTGRGIDQVLPHPGAPRLYEPYVKSALTYVELAERANGPIPRPVDFPYIWGDALDELQRVAPDARIVNLETAVTTSSEPWPGKGIHYRMHPANTPCLTAAGIDCCVLANNHVLDWGYRGLGQTLETLHQAGLKTTGAGSDLTAAQAPTLIEAPGKGRVLVFGGGAQSSGIPPAWGAASARAGVHLLPDLSGETVRRMGRLIEESKRPGDVAVVSIHWDQNWGYGIPDEHVQFAHGLIDEAGADLVHGHSSHHPKAIEVYRGKAILYGCGDFLNDYEGIEGQEAFRPDLVLMYFVTVDPESGRLLRLAMTPMQVRRMRLNRPSRKDARWLASVLDREARKFGAGVELGTDAGFDLRW